MHYYLLPPEFLEPELFLVSLLPELLVFEFVVLELFEFESLVLVVVELLFELELFVFPEPEFVVCVTVGVVISFVLSLFPLPPEFLISSVSEFLPSFLTFVTTLSPFSFVVVI